MRPDGNASGVAWGVAGMRVESRVATNVARGTATDTDGMLSLPAVS